MKKGEKMKYTYYQLGIMAAVVSFLGFVVENIWLAMTKGYINNRNMNAPFLLGYGLLILFMYAVFGTPAAFKMFTKEKVRWKRYLLYFLCSFVVVCLGEIVLGIAVEALCNIEYSDAYYKIYFNTDQYGICGNDYNSDGKCISGFNGRNLPY